MSIRIMSLVWEMHLPDSEKIVLLALADCANDEGHCWPSVASLVKKCCKSDRTIQNAIQMLCTKGHITRREVLGKGCNYTVHPIVRLDTPEKIAPRNSFPPKPFTQTPEAVSDKPSRTSSVSNETGVAADPVKDLFDVGVALLMATGQSERQARTLIGKWRKARTDAEVLQGILDCRAKAISDPVPWLEQRFRSAKYVSASGYEYRGSLESILREAERRNDMGTYWKVKSELKTAA